MQVILLEKYLNLGNLGDEVSVKSGFGRNFLIPRGKALPATDKNRAEFEARRVELEAAVAELRSKAEKRRDKLIAAGDITIKANASIEGKLFGSVSALDIAQALSVAGADIERNEIRLPGGPLRHTGEYHLDIQLHPDVIVSVKVNVLTEAQLQQLGNKEAEPEETTAQQEPTDDDTQ